VTDTRRSVIWRPNLSASGILYVGCGFGVAAASILILRCGAGGNNQGTQRMEFRSFHAITLHLRQVRQSGPELA
jgi:hypothetical protein